MTEVRYARVQTRHGKPSAQEVAAYLPANYRISAEVWPETKDDYGAIILTGTDNAGWTLDHYVIPRLGSGLIHCSEIPPETMVSRSLWACGCLANKAGAHRVGCPSYPEEVRP